MVCDSVCAWYWYVTYLEGNINIRLIKKVTAKTTKNMLAQFELWVYFDILVA